VDQVPDRIERELLIAVPRERVWAALTEPERLSAWFGTSAEVDLRPGGAMIFVWDAAATTDGAQHANPAMVEVVDRPNRLVFRWRPFAGYEGLPLTVGPFTRVEFILEEHPRGTRLRLIESGFANLPPDVRRRQHASNTRGWDRELGDLDAYLSPPT
jgi:uncharacterized protein YndB with AHSA1/START domain